MLLNLLGLPWGEVGASSSLPWLALPDMDAIGSAAPLLGGLCAGGAGGGWAGGAVGGWAGGAVGGCFG